MTDAELTILSLVAEGARYGHEIQQIIDERGLREWITIGFSSVYYILNKLEQQNMVTGALKMEGGRGAHKAYTITDAGRGVLQTAIADLLRQPRSLGTGFELGLVNMGALKPRQVYDVLSHHRQDLAQRLQAVETAWTEHRANDPDPVNDHIRALFTHSIAIMTAELQWLTEFLEDWKGRYPGVERDKPASAADVEASAASTRIHYRESSDPAQMLQRLKRPRPQPADDEDDSNNNAASGNHPLP